MTATRLGQLATRPALGWVERWARHSQELACRNAMVATTVALERRRDREEVEDYLAALLTRCA